MLAYDGRHPHLSACCVGATPAANADLLAALEDSPLFGGLPYTVLPDLLGHFKRDKWKGARPNITPAHAKERFYLVVAGHIRLFRVNPKSGRELTLILLGPGDAFDVSVLLTGERLIGSAQGFAGLETVSVSMSQARTWRTLYPEFYRGCERYVIDQCSRIADLATELALFGADVRLARLLLRRAGGEAGDAPLRPIEGLSHELIASLIGSSRESVTREVTRFKQQGLIVGGRGSISVADREGLERCCLYAGASKGISAESR